MLSWVEHEKSLKPRGQIGLRFCGLSKAFIETGTSGHWASKTQISLHIFSFLSGLLGLIRIVQYQRTLKVDNKGLAQTTEA